MTTSAVARSRPSDLWVWCLLALAALPLFAIRGLPGAEWDGDAFLFRLHARNLAEGRPYGDSGYLRESGVPCAGPAVHPPGFPLLLALVSHLPGGLDANAEILVCLCLVLLGFAAFAWFRGYAPPWVAAVLVLALWYHPWTLAAKSRILADFPFALCLLLAWLAIHSRRPRVQASLWILLPALVLLRTIGWTLPMAMFAFALMHGPVQRLFRTVRMPPPALYAKPVVWVGLILWTLACRLAVYASLAIPPAVPRGEASVFPGPGGVFLGNIDLTLSRFLGFFPTLGGFSFPGQALAAFALSFLLLGAMRKIRCPGLLEGMLGFHLALLLAWPCPRGFRVYFPLVPFFVPILLDGFRVLGRGHKPAALFSLSFLALCLLGESATPDSALSGVPGPTHAASVEMFEAVKTWTEPGARVDFFLPQAMAFHGERRSRKLRLDRSAKGEVPDHFYIVTLEAADGAGPLLWSNEWFFLYAGATRD